MLKNVKDTIFNCLYFAKKKSIHLSLKAILNPAALTILHSLMANAKPWEVVASKGPFMAR